MATVIQIRDIDDALANLNYGNPNTQKYKLVHAIRKLYLSEDSEQFPKEIDATELVKALWDTGEDPALIKSKKKNLSSTKSSVNADLKKLYQEGGNPNGIIIGRNNTFDLSDEAKNKALTKLAESLRGTKEGLIGKIAEVIETINDYLSNPDTLAEKDTDEGLKKLEGMKQLVLDLCKKVGLSPDEMPGTGDDTVAGSSSLDAGLVNAADEKGGTGHLPKEKTGETVPTAKAPDDAPPDEMGGVKSTGKFNELLTENDIEAYEQEKARDAAWQDLDLEGAVDTNVVLEEDPLEAEDIVAEASFEEPLEAAEEIVEEVAVGESDEQTAELAAAEPGADGGSDDLLSGPAPGEGFDEAATGSGLIEVFESDLPADEVPLETEDAVVETAAEDALEAAEEILEEVMGEESDEHTAGIEGAESGAGGVGGDSFSGSIQEEGLGTTGTEPALEELIEAEASPEKELPEAEGIVAEASLEEPLEATDEIHEDVAIGESDGHTAGRDAAEPGAVGAVDEPLSGPVPGEGLDAAGSETSLEELIEAEIETSPEDVPVETEDILVEPTAEDTLEAADEIVEEVADDALLDEADEGIEEDLRSKAEFLSNLAEAAKMLEKLGPDLNDSIYSEEELKEKAKLLSEEFDRYLAIRDKFFNQHILIKEGTYAIGSREPKDHERSEQAISLPTFYIGKFPVTNALFEIFVENTGYKTTAEKCGYGLVYSARGRKEKDPKTGRERFIWKNYQEYKLVEGACWHQPSGPGSSIHDKRRHPVVQVSLEDARAFAAWTGKRIPAESEWEAAARTRLGHRYPWGNEWKEKSCNVEKSYIGDTTPVDQYLESINGSGLADTLGNVLEWTLDAWTNPATGEKDPQYYITKGGSWASNGSLSLFSRFRIAKNTTSNILGFRCVAI